MILELPGLTTRRIEERALCRKGLPPLPRGGV
jgi:GH24 family phage-related lysozyme (muramidase)